MVENVLHPINANVKLDLVGGYVSQVSIMWVLLRLGQCYISHSYTAHNVEWRFVTYISSVQTKHEN